MPYTPTNWEDLPSVATPITAAELNRIEAGVDAAVEFADTHPGAVDPHTQYQKESEKGQAGGYASLDGSGTVPAAQIPAIAITTYLGSVADQSAMLALSGQVGDWAIRSDLGQTAIITGADPTQLSSWTFLAYPAAPVVSVNSETGAVVLDATDVGAEPAGTVATHSADTTGVHGIADTSQIILEGDARLSDARTPTTHEHDDRYYTETETDTLLSGKSNTGHLHDDRYYTESETDTLLSNKADLVGGLVPSSQIPAIAVTEYLGAAVDQTAMLALVGQKGDFCTRTDTGTNWVITGNDPTQLADWTQLSYPTAPVTSVNSQTGAVVLSAGDVGAAPVSHGHSSGDVSGLATVATSGAYTDLSGKPTLGDAAAKNTGTSAGTVAAGDDSRITGAIQSSERITRLARGAMGRFTFNANTAVAATSASEIRFNSATASTITQIAHWSSDLDGGAAVNYITANVVPGDLIIINSSLALGTNGGITLRATGIPAYTSPNYISVEYVSGSIPSNGTIVDFGVVHQSPDVPLSRFTNKGDIVAATGAGAVQRVGIGSNNQVLTADSTQPAGVRWSTPSVSATGVWHTYTSGGTINRLAGPPSNALGANGDYALDLSSGAVFGPKTGGSWAAGPSTFLARPGDELLNMGVSASSMTMWSNYHNLMRVEYPNSGTNGVLLGNGYLTTNGLYWNSANTGWEVVSESTVQIGNTYSNTKYVKGGSISFKLVRKPTGTTALIWGLGMAYGSIIPAVEVGETYAKWTSTMHSSGVNFSGYTPQNGDEFYMQSMLGKYDLQIVRSGTLVYSSINAYTGEYTLGGTFGWLVANAGGVGAVQNPIIGKTVYNMAMVAML